MFFIGYFLLEIPGTLIVENGAPGSGSAGSWSLGNPGRPDGVRAAPWQFYAVRFLLGLAEAGFFPGSDRLPDPLVPQPRPGGPGWFFIATPIAQIISPKISYRFSRSALEGNPPMLGMVGWQWVYIFWGVPAVVLGVVVLLFLTDRPGQAHWLDPEEREALGAELEHEKAHARPATT